MSSSFVSLAPCRLCLFGEHQDYLNLPVIALSLPLFCRIQVTIHDDEGCLTLEIPQKKQTIVYEMDKLPPLDTENPDFALAALHDALKDGWKLPSATFISTSDLPMQAGVSTSSAFCVAWIQALAKLANISLDPLQLAQRAHHAEVVAFGAPGGTMDHVTSALGGLLRIGPDPWQVERLILDDNLFNKDLTDDPMGCWVLAYSGEPKDTLRHLTRCKDSRLKLLEKLGGDWDADNVELTDDEKVLLDATRINRDTQVEAYNLLKSESVNGKELGGLMKQHHEALRGGLFLSSDILEAMNKAALQSGAWGFKVVGSGGGGCGVAWCARDCADTVAQAMKNAGAVESWIIKEPCSIGAHIVDPADSNTNVYGGFKDDSATITLITYGKWFGSIDKTECDQVWNCTKIPNPACQRKGTTGLSKRFRSEVMKDPIAASIVEQAVRTIVEDDSLDDCDSRVVIGSKYAFFCEYGKHRSVSVAETVAEKVRCYKASVKVEHRDVYRKLGKKDVSS